MAKADIDPGSGRARLSYRRAAEIFEDHTTDFRPAGSLCTNCGIRS